MVPSVAIQYYLSHSALIETEIAKFHHLEDAVVKTITP